MVQSGGCSANDSREVFKKHIEKRVRSLPEIDGLSKETVLSSWMAKFDAIYRGEEDPRKQQARMTASAASELILSKEQLYEMFQNILGIKKFEHQLLYNACQVRSFSQAGWEWKGFSWARACRWEILLLGMETLGLTRLFLRRLPLGKGVLVHGGTSALPVMFWLSKWGSFFCSCLFCLGWLLRVSLQMF